MSTTALSVRNLSKRYRIGLEEEQPDTLAETVMSWISSPIQNYRRLRRLSSFDGEGGEDVIWALRDVSFEVDKGEVVGVIGRNGAGKSTLLKVLSQITAPTRGSADLYGRVSSLLEVGTGFHRELTGRENVYLNGTILGMTKPEVDAKFDDIVEFSGIGQFIDTPVKRYSSGMRVRLAFAVAAHLEPEILLIDEVLAVGDAGFQKKCLGKMDEVAQSGRTVLFVSHQMGAVQELCPRTLVLEGGELVFDGNTQEAISRYYSLVGSTSQRRATFDDDPDAKLCIREIRVEAQGKPLDAAIDIGDTVEIHVIYRVRQILHGTNVGIMLHREGVPLLASFDVDESPEYHRNREPGLYHARIELPSPLLKAGRYVVGVDAGHTGRGQRLDAHPEALSFEIEELSVDVTHKSYAQKRPGALALPLEWDVERDPDLASASGATSGSAPASVSSSSSN
jgi:lipopolysaccharide transport system ATP-binding protein